jgi:Sulfotransferase domain
MQRLADFETYRSIFRKARGLGRRFAATLSAPPKPQTHDARVSMGQTEVGTFDEKDIFVVSYPRSGNNWLQYLMVEIIYGVNPQIAPASLVKELGIDVHSRKYYTRYRTPCFFKSHALPTPEYRRVIYLLRDGRDAMVSYFHYIKTLNHLNELDELDVLRNGTYLFPCKWHDHVEQWLANPFNSDMMIVRYEELRTQPVETLQKFCAFAGVQRDTEFLEQVVARTAFSTMQKMERNGAEGWSPNNWPGDKQFIRRGQVGSFKDEMSPEVLAEFLRQAGDTLRKVGYQTN